MPLGPMPQSPDGGPPSDEQLAAYIADMLTELKHLGKGPRFRTVSYLIEMARLEAERMAKEMPDSEPTPPPPTS